MGLRNCLDTQPNVAPPTGTIRFGVRRMHVSCDKPAGTACDPARQVRSLIPRLIDPPHTCRRGHHAALLPNRAC
jgi:hypothetical protein